MSSHELQCALMLMLEFSNVYYKLYQVCHLNNKYRYKKEYVQVISLSNPLFCGCTFKEFYLVNRSE